MNIVAQIKYDCRSRAKWVREKTAQGIPLDDIQLQSARNFANNAFKWDYDSASQELYDAVAENQKLII
nr:MAG TPA: hypothetical protein [Caudoviricetes sp.]